MQQADITSLDQLDPLGTYSHLEYLTWKFHERVELILGKISLLETAANLRHQQCSQVINVAFWNHLTGSGCHVFQAPFDVFFLGENGAPDTVLQPDIVVVCDVSKLNLKGCYGSPDLVVEILSPSTASRDLNEKYRIYEAYGVTEYWIVHPEEKTVTIHVRDGSGKFIALEKRGRGDRIGSPLFPGLEVNLDLAFENLIREDAVDYEIDYPVRRIH